jgi:hypothetical protein
MSNFVAPNALNVSLDYRGADMVWRPVALSGGLSKPVAVQPEVTDQDHRGRITGASITKYPLPKGKITILDIPATPGQFTIRDAALNVNGGAAITGTNANIERIVPTTAKLLDLRFRTNMQDSRGRVMEEIMTGVWVKFAESPSESDSGNTHDADLTVYGAIQAPVYL